MSLFEQAMVQFTGMTFAEVAQEVDLTPAQVETAIGAIGTARAQPGSTTEIAAVSSALPIEKIQAILDAIGGEGVIDRIKGALSQGGGTEAIMSGLFGKN